MPQKIALALSGGVDSSSAAYLLKQAGYDVTAVYLRFWARDQAEKRRIDQEAERAEQIAHQLGLEFITLDFAQKQHEQVVDYFIKAYQAGDSPNPCIVCNRTLKFGELLDWALAKGFDFLATGHYAQIIEEKNHHYLASALDSQKDQSYFLYQLDEKKLNKLLFPLGQLTKQAVRQIADQANLKIKQGESFDVCFLNKISLKKFLAQNIVAQPGEIVDRQGLVLGQHQGLAFYTIGQRQGFQIDHRLLKDSQSITFNPNSPPALYVVAKHKELNQLVIGEQNACFSQKFYVKNLHFINPSNAETFLATKKLLAQVKVRNTGQLFSCQLELTTSNDLLVSTKEAIFGLAGGQAAVFYQTSSWGTMVLAGATIDRVAASAKKN